MPDFEEEAAATKQNSTNKDIDGTNEDISKYFVKYINNDTTNDSKDINTENKKLNNESSKKSAIKKKNTESSKKVSNKTKTLDCFLKK